MAVVVQKPLAHVSAVHGSPSSQSGGGPPAQTPLTHVSAVVHGFASLHALPSASGSLTQPNTGSQSFAVQGLASTHPAGRRVRQWRSQVGQPGGSHCSGNSAVRLPQAGQGTRQPAGGAGAGPRGSAAKGEGGGPGG